MNHFRQRTSASAMSYERKTTFQNMSQPSSRRRQSPRGQCWLSKFTYALITFVFILLLSRNNKTNNFATDQSYLRSGEINKDCRILEMMSPENISKLKELDLSSCSLTSIPESIKYASNLEKLDVSNNSALTTLPDELINCSKLEILFASSCPSIKTLPAVLGRMESLTRLGWRSGSLTTIDPDGLPPNLVHLILTDNKIEKMESFELFDKLKHVRKLMLSHNKINTFGDDQGSIKKLQNLELLRIAGNQLDHINDDLWVLPKLTWLTISGNPLGKIQNESKVPWIGTEDLKSTGKYLGEGASGKVTSYIWKKQEVAVKIIHGVTSDGRAEDELSIYGAVGSDGLQHRVVGCVALLRGDKKGAVMQQLPSNLIDLALPPTIVEVTQDRWDNWNENVSFDSSFVLNVLNDVVNALKFLHGSVGVAHGDIYAHNLKVNKASGRAYVLDFGASYFTDSYAHEAQRLEVRAFGILVGELMSKLDHDAHLRVQLNSLQLKCMDNDVQSRPSFNEIADTVQSLLLKIQ